MGPQVKVFKGKFSEVAINAYNEDFYQTFVIAELERIANPTRSNIYKTLNMQHNSVLDKTVLFIVNPILKTENWIELEEVEVSAAIALEADVSPIAELSKTDTKTKVIKKSKETKKSKKAESTKDRKCEKPRTSMRQFDQQLLKLI